MVQCCRLRQDRSWRQSAIRNRRHIHYGWKRVPQGVHTRENRSIKLGDIAIELTSSVFMRTALSTTKWITEMFEQLGCQRTWLNINEMGLCHIRVCYVLRQSTIAVPTLHCNKGWCTHDQAKLETKKKFHDKESPTISPSKEIQSEVIIEEVRGNCLCNH
jgi:hypothetical protein